MNIKQVFCKHIWKSVSFDLIRRIRSYFFEDFMYNEYEIYAVKQSCVKCDKHRIVESKQLVKYMEWEHENH